MKKMQLREIKDIELDILIAFNKFCQDNNLKYYLSGGTLLGAIRHKGFIPWDDDIDVCMPRPDYERLMKIFPNIYMNKYKLKTISRKNFICPFAKIIDINTRVDFKYLNNIDKNLWLDIFPIDGLPKSKKKQIEFIS